MDNITPNFTTPSLPAGNIQSVGHVVNNYDLRQAVANYFDWNGLFRNSKTFAALNAFGQVSATVPMSSAGAGNYKVLFNKPTGFLTEYETDSNFVLTIASPYCDLAADIAGETNGRNAVHPVFTLDEITSDRGSLSGADATIANLSTALDLYNIKIHEGLGLRVIADGANGDLYDDSNAALKGASCAFVFRGTDSGKLVCELMDSSVPKSATPTKLAKIAGKVTILVTDFAEFDGAAPLADDLGTTQYGNWLQMFDATVGKGYSEESQATYFDNSFETLIEPLRQMQNVKMNTDVLFGMRGSIPTDNPNTGTSRGAMKGIWGLMNLHNANLNVDQAKPAIRVDGGTTLDFWKLYSFVEDRPSYVNKSMLCICTPKMSLLLKQAAEATRELERVPSIAFPGVPGDISYSFKIGDTTLHCITDKILSYHPRFMDYENHVAAQGKVMLMLDMRYAGLIYQQNKELGLMVPQIAEIASVNDERKRRAHLMACFTTAIWNPQMHAFYGISDN